VPPPIFASLPAPNTEPRHRSSDPATPQWWALNSGAKSFQLKLFAPCFNNCVAHFYCLRFKATMLGSRKAEIIRKTLPRSSRRTIAISPPADGSATAIRERTVGNTITIIGTATLNFLQEDSGYFR
jgi:hypothetical protein